MRCQRFDDEERPVGQEIRQRTVSVRASVWRSSPLFAPHIRLAVFATLRAKTARARALVCRKRALGLASTEMARCMHDRWRVEQILHCIVRSGDDEPEPGGAVARTCPYPGRARAMVVLAIGNRLRERKARARRISSSTNATFGE